MARFLRKGWKLIQAGLGFIEVPESGEEWVVDWNDFALGLTGWFRTKRYPDEGKRFRIERFIPILSGWVRTTSRELRPVEWSKLPKIVHFISAGEILYHPERDTR